MSETLAGPAHRQRRFITTAAALIVVLAFPGCAAKKPTPSLTVAERALCHLRSENLSGAQRRKSAALTEKGVRVKGRQPLSPPQHIETRSAFFSASAHGVAG
jgi:hypothetical protein